ncbi:MAG: hypothetical protein ACRCZI_08450 [Cetobacterium sp.]
MGIKDFTKVFEHHGEFKYKEFEGKRVVIDASVEIYRAALGMKIGEQLTNSFGVPTSHINTILLGVILKLKAAGAEQYWVFDQKNIGDLCHNPMKQLELKKRKQKREDAKTKIADTHSKKENVKNKVNELNDKMESLKLKKSTKVTDHQLSEDDLFSDESDDDEEMDKYKKEMLQYQEEIEKCEDIISKKKKSAFTLESFYIEDTIFLLDSLCIPWVQSPAGYESEQLCAWSTQSSIVFGEKMDYVLSPDSDALVFGAKVLIKRDIRKKKLFKYDLKRLLGDYDIPHVDLVKIALILGSDYADKTPGIGIKTVFKKYKNVVLTDEQIEAFKAFTEPIPTAIIELLEIHNVIYKPFSDDKKYKQMLDWLELVKNYNRDRIKKQFHKQNIFVDID